MINKPSVARYMYNVDSDKESSKLIATSSHEVVSVLATATGTSLAARIYDTKDPSALDPSRSILIAANAGESSSFTPAQPIPFREGIYIVIEQGASTGGELFITYN